MLEQLRPLAPTTPRERLLQATVMLSALAGLAAGFYFGYRVSGVLLGVLAALNCAAMGAALASTVADWMPEGAGRRG